MKIILTFILWASGTLAAESLFDDPIVARGKGVEIRQGRLEETFIHHKANLASRGKAMPEGQRALREAQLLDRLIVTQLLIHRATDADRAKARELADKFTEESKKLVSSEDSFYRQLKAMGLSAEAYRKIVDEQALAE